jgi:hypothetical protein
MTQALHLDQIPHREEYIVAVERLKKIRDVVHFLTGTGIHTITLMHQIDTISSKYIYRGIPVTGDMWMRLYRTAMELMEKDLLGSDLEIEKIKKYYEAVPKLDSYVNRGEWDKVTTIEGELFAILKDIRRGESHQ